MAMMRKRILLGGLIVFCFLGVLLPVTEPAADETREIRVVQDAITAEKLEWRADVTPL